MISSKALLDLSPEDSLQVIAHRTGEGTGREEGEVGVGSSASSISKHETDRSSKQTNENQKQELRQLDGTVKQVRDLIWVQKELNSD